MGEMAKLTGGSLSPGSKVMPNTFRKMEHQISVSENKGIFEIIISGDVKEGAAEKVTDVVTGIIKANDVKNMIMDVRAVQGRFGIAETFSIVRGLPSKRQIMNTAFLDIVQNASYGSIHEATALNAGLSFKWFTDIHAARVWLKSKQRLIG
jgi:hypothetical protein